MTKDILKQYRYLSEVIRKDEEKLQHYKDNPPEAYLGKVQSSNKQFPYQRISVTGGHQMDSDNLHRGSSDQRIGRGKRICLRRF